MTDLIATAETELREAILAIQQPRTDFQLTHFVVGQHDTDPRAWMQCVLELQLKLHAIKRGEIERRQAARKLAEMEESDTRESQDEAELLRLDLEQHDLAMLGARREVETLLAIYRSFGRQYTHAELMAAEGEYWMRRLTRQAKHALIATGRVPVGELDSFAQIGVPVTLDRIRQWEQETCLPTSDCNGPSKPIDEIPMELPPPTNTNGD